MGVEAQTLGNDMNEEIELPQNRSCRPLYIAIAEAFSEYAGGARGRCSLLGVFRFLWRCARRQLAALARIQCQMLFLGSVVP
jgi:hypothetical protein